MIVNQLVDPYSLTGFPYFVMRTYSVHSRQALARLLHTRVYMTITAACDVFC